MTPFLIFCDPTEQGKGKGLRFNLVVHRAEVVAKDAGNPQLASEIASLLTQLKSAVEPLRNHRDKRIAHQDEPVHTGAVDLPDITEPQIVEAMRLISDTMNAVHRALSGNEWGYQHSVGIGAKAIVYYLQSGLELEEVRATMHGQSDADIAKAIRELDERL